MDIPAGEITTSAPNNIVMPRMIEPPPPIGAPGRTPPKAMAAIGDIHRNTIDFNMVERIVDPHQVAYLCETSGTVMFKIDGEDCKCISVSLFVYENDAEEEKALEGLRQLALMETKVEHAVITVVRVRGREKLIGALVTRNPVGDVILPMKSDPKTIEFFEPETAPDTDGKTLRNNQRLIRALVAHQFRLKHNQPLPMIGDKLKYRHMGALLQGTVKQIAAGWDGNTIEDIGVGIVVETEGHQVSVWDDIVYE